jgi:hypothetical protein
MIQLGLLYIYAWKQHRETPCVAHFISNKQKCHVFLFIFYLLQNWKTGEQEGGTDSVGGVEGVATSRRGEMARKQLGG